MESASNTRPTRGILPCLTNPPCSQTPTSVPTLSNKSTNKNANKISRKPRWMAERKSNCKNVEDGCGMEKIAEGQLEILRSMPSSAVPTIPIKMAALIFLAIKIRVNTSPKHAVCTSLSAKLPRPTNVAELETISFALRIPTKAMNIPIPAAVECFRQSGMPLTICSRTRVTVRTRKSTPEKNTTASAVRHGTCMERQTEYVK